MTDDQFDALVQLASIRTAQTVECVWLVLVEGESQAEAARKTGMSRQAAHQAVKRAQAVIELAGRLNKRNKEN